MSRFEYKVIPCSGLAGDTQILINQWAKEGWEVHNTYYVPDVGLDYRLSIIFKRPAESTLKDLLDKKAWEPGPGEELAPECGIPNCTYNQ